MSWRLEWVDSTDIWSSSNVCLVPLTGLDGREFSAADGGSVKLSERTRKVSESLPGNRVEAIR